jgi:hypothetical protein
MVRGIVTVFCLVQLGALVSGCGPEGDLIDLGTDDHHHNPPPADTKAPVAVFGNIGPEDFVLNGHAFSITVTDDLSNVTYISIQLDGTEITGGAPQPPAGRLGRIRMPLAAA